MNSENFFFTQGPGRTFFSRLCIKYCANGKDIVVNAFMWKDGQCCHFTSTASCSETGCCANKMARFEGQLAEAVKHSHL